MKLYIEVKGRKSYKKQWMGGLIMDGAIIDEQLQILCIILNRGDEDISYKDLPLPTAIKR